LGRIKQSPIFLLNVVFPQLIHFLFELVVLLDEELIHLHELPVGLVLLLLVPAQLSAHLHQDLCVGLDQFLLLPLRLPQHYAHLFDEFVFLLHECLHLRQFLLVELLQFFQVVGVDESFLLDA
jgi:hypothetical protein